MNKNGPIVIIEDDVDDQELMVEIFRNLGCRNQILYFDDGHKALDYLTTSKAKPFLIISDVNMPRLNGFELRDKIHNNEELSLKCIPFLFLTTSASQKAVVEAYSMSAQGFFVKPAGFDNLEKMIKTIMDYWLECIAPNSIE